MMTMHARTLYLAHKNPAGLQHRCGPVRSRRRYNKVATFQSMQAGLIEWRAQLYALTQGFCCSSPVEVLQHLLRDRDGDPWQSLSTLHRIADRAHLPSAFAPVEWSDAGTRIVWSAAILSTVLWHPQHTLLLHDAPLDWQLHDKIMARPWP